MSIPTITQVCERAQRLPCSPVLLPRLIKVLEDENSSSQDVEEIICMDTALAGGTLRIANSAFFGASGRRVSRLLRRSCAWAQGRFIAWPHCRWPVAG
ncbi:MAG TPA: HDOD domain-containing protein [Opitutaceae bacterium]|nr:HDOD domain-containing protein [Opitutaceae bacterium]